MLLKVNFTNRQTFCKIPKELNRLLLSVCRATLDNLGMTRNYEVEINYVDDKRIRSYNRQFRHKDAKTDVLSFPLGENHVWEKNPSNGLFMLGDIVISTETAYAQAAEYGHSPEREFAFLTAHSMLHILGYDHENEQERVQMRLLEEEILTNLGLAREE